MKSSQFLYLATIIFFVGIGNYRLWRHNGKTLKKHWRFIISFALLSMPFAYWDAVAQRWGAYFYNPDHTLYLQVHGGELETYLFLGGISAAVVSATIIYAKREDASRPLSNKKRRSAKRKIRKPALAFAGSKR